jgi:hypothetical protein
MQANWNKQRLIKLWIKRKQEIERQLIKDHITTDKEFYPYALRLFHEVGPLWLQSFQDDYPQEAFNHFNLKTWLEKNINAYKTAGKSKEALAWVQMYNYFLTLLEMDIIPRDPYQPIKEPHSI